MKKLLLASVTLLVGVSVFGQSSPDSVSVNSALGSNNAVMDGKANFRPSKKQESETNNKRLQPKLKRQDTYNNSLTKSEDIDSTKTDSIENETENQRPSNPVPSVAQRQPR
jgi:hypothetical protein